MEKYKPQRMCVCCRKVADKELFARIVRLPSGEIVFDKTSKLDGRGCYVCKATACIEKLVKSHALNRSFKSAVDGEAYQKIISELNGAED